MTMTDTEAKALALVNEFRAKSAEPTLPVTTSHVWAYGAAWEALCRTIEREAATEARHAAELREQAERFSEVVTDWFGRYSAEVPPQFQPFILPAPDPLVDALEAALWDVSNVKLTDRELTVIANTLRKIGEAGE